MRAATRALAAASIALAGCSAIIGVKDLTYDPNASENGGGDGGGSDGASGADGGGDAGATCVADLQTDKANCGRCGHDCGGGECNAGKCQPIQIGAVNGAPLEFVFVSASHVFVAPLVRLTTDTGGLWRIAKSGGAVEEYVKLRYAEWMVGLGDKLWFTVEDDPANGSDKTGGLYTCPLEGAAPCAPSLVAAADNPRALVLDKGALYYGDQAADKGLMKIVPPGAPAIFRAGFGFPRYLFVDGEAAFYNVTYAPSSPPQKGRLIEILPDAGYEIRYEYSSDTANAGRLVGSPSSLLVTGYDYDGPTSKGVVHRVPRAGGVLPCDYGGDGNTRPFGLAADGTRVYWTNLGTGAAEPYTAGSLATCELAGCCASPEILWKGDGEPSAVALDDAFVYWVVEKTGAVWKVAKP